MLKYRYYICSAYFPVDEYLLGEDEHFQDIWIPLEYSAAELQNQTAELTDGGQK